MSAAQQADSVVRLLFVAGYQTQAQAQISSVGKNKELVAFGPRLGNESSSVEKSSDLKIGNFLYPKKMSIDFNIVLVTTTTPQTEILSTWQSI
jgi:hypothetical protein